MRARGWTSGDGEYTRRSHDLLERELAVPRVLLTTSCTHALEMAAILLHVSPGDEVIVPDFTFVSTANAFVLRGATPVFVDIRSDTLNLDERLLAEKVTPKTRAIVAVHYAGVGCDMKRSRDRPRGDPAWKTRHGLVGLRGGRASAPSGPRDSCSRNENFTAEGGALIVNDRKYIDAPRCWKGHNRKRFFPGRGGQVHWVTSGRVPAVGLLGRNSAAAEKKEASSRPAGASTDIEAGVSIGRKVWRAAFRHSPDCE